MLYYVTIQLLGNSQKMKPRFFGIITTLLFILVSALSGCGKEEKVSQQKPTPKKESKKSELPLPKVLPKKLEDHPSSTKVLEDGNLLPLIQKGKKALENLPTLEYSEEKVRKGKKVVAKRLEYDIAFAVAHIERQEVETVTVSHTKAKSSTSSVKGGNFVFTAEKWNGCNTPFDIKKPDGYIVLALRCLIGKGKTVESLVYTPYTKEIDTPKLRYAGYQYLRDKLIAAEKELKSQGVKSFAFPGELAADVVPMSVAFRLALIEHIEPSLVDKTSPEELINRVLVTIAANREDAYTTAKSKAGAYGQFQFIPGTYKAIVKKYKRANLISDFTEGMRNHLNAAKASLLLFDSDLAIVKGEMRDGLRSDPKALALYLAAAYNGGAPRASKTIERYGAEWREHLPKETFDYLRKIEMVNKIIKG